MKKTELLARIEELERRVRELEARPAQIVTVPVVVPSVYPAPTWPVFTESPPWPQLRWPTVTCGPPANTGATGCITCQ